MKKRKETHGTNHNTTNPIHRPSMGNAGYAMTEDESIRVHYRTNILLGLKPCMAIYETAKATGYSKFRVKCAIKGKA